MGERTETRTFLQCDRCKREIQNHNLDDHDWVSLHGQKRNGGSFFLPLGDGYKVLVCNHCSIDLKKWFTNPVSWVFEPKDADTGELLKPLVIDEAGFLGKKVGLAPPPHYGGHSSLADMVRTHINVWRGLLQEVVDDASLGSASYWKHELKVLAEIDEACMIDAGVNEGFAKGETPRVKLSPVDRSVLHGLKTGQVVGRGSNGGYWFGNPDGSTEDITDSATYLLLNGYVFDDGGRIILTNRGRAAE